MDFHIPILNFHVANDYSHQLRSASILTGVDIPAAIRANQEGSLTPDMLEECRFMGFPDLPLADAVMLETFLTGQVPGLTNEDDRCESPVMEMISALTALGVPVFLCKEANYDRINVPEPRGLVRRGLPWEEKRYFNQLVIDAGGIPIERIGLNDAHEIRSVIIDALEANLHVPRVERVGVVGGIVRRGLSAPPVSFVPAEWKVWGDYL